MEFNNLDIKFQILEWNALVLLKGANLPTYLFVLVCVIIWVVFLSNDVQLGVFIV
jgi:hypothetical protein